METEGLPHGAGGPGPQAEIAKMIPREICPKCNWKREMVDGKLVCPKCGSKPHRRPRARYGALPREEAIKAKKPPRRPASRPMAPKRGEDTLAPRNPSNSPYLEIQPASEEVKGWK